MLARLFRSRNTADEAAALDLYRVIVGQARNPVFYVDPYGVPDTLDGRFDLLILHAFLVFHRLKGQGPAAAQRAQALFDLMIADFDRNLREMGVGDLSVGKRVKEMVRGFYGRAAAYERGLAGADDRVLVAALDRNLFGTREPTEAQLARFARYVRREATALAALPLERVMAGDFQFGAPDPTGADD